MPGQGTGRGLIQPTGHGLYVAPGDQVTTDAFAAVVGSTLDTAIRGQDSVAFTLAEAGGVKGITFEVQGALEDVDASYVSLKTYDETGAQRGATSIAVVAGGIAYAILPDRLGSEAAFRYYRARVKSTSAGQAGTGRLRGFAK